MRALMAAAPDVMRGFEGSPGHQAASLNGKMRCSYTGEKREGSWEGYKEENYASYGGFDSMTAKVGGLWDTLLAQGIPAYITATGNCHRHWQDLNQTDDADFETKGRIAVTSKRMEKADNEDFYPGEYSRTMVYASSADPMALMQSMRTGNMFACLGGLVERCELLAISGDQVRPMGGILQLKSATDSLLISIRIKINKKKNPNGLPPKLDHIDLIAGNIEERAYRPDTFTNPSAGIIATVTPSQGEKRGDFVDYGFKIDKVDGSFFFRIRGTNRADVKEPSRDTETVKPWEDLWFYSNPIFIRVPKA
jgi:hypothetical protein